MKISSNLLRASVCLSAFLASTSAPRASTNELASGTVDRNLRIAPSTTAVAGGKATLTIGLLQRTNGIYRGTYKMTVNPYFFKNENGQLAINVSNQNLADAAAGKTVAVTGTAQESGRGGVTRRIDAVATPAAEGDHGSLKLWFLVDQRKMVFETTYHFADRPAATPAAGAEKPLALKMPAK